MKPLKLDALIARLIELREKDLDVTGESTIIVEGYNEAGDFIQGRIESVSTESRCEEDDQAQAVYINLIDEDTECSDAGDGTCVYDHQASETECTLVLPSEGGSKP